MRCVITGGGETATEAVGVGLAMWEGKILLAVKTIPQETHPLLVKMALPVLSLLGGGAILYTTRQGTTRTGVRTPGGNTRIRTTEGHCVEIKVTVAKSQIAPIFTIRRIFPNTPEPKGSEEPTKEETTNSDHKCDRSKWIQQSKVCKVQKEQ